MQRAAGLVRLTATGAGLAELEQRGCLRACFPRAHGGALEAVILNTAGGVADGDVLSLTAEAGLGADMVVTTSAAERIYRALPGSPPACMDVRLRIARGASLAYLPQETILFEASALRRTLHIDLEPGGRYLGVEALVFGRQHAGETLQRLCLRDTIRLRQGGRLTLHDAIRLEGDIGRALPRRASAGSSQAIATILQAGPNAACCLPGLRDLLPTLPVEAGASSWDGMLVVRLLAGDAQALRHAVVACLSVMRGGRPLPRVWSS